MPVLHKIYGLTLASPVALPGLPILIGERGAADVYLRFNESRSSHPSSAAIAEPFYISAGKDERGEPLLRVTELNNGEYFALSYSDGARFMLYRSGHEVHADWPDALTLEDACIYLLGPVLGFVLHLRGTVPLHASGVSIDDHAIALMGPAGAGKSTAAAAFARFGKRVISDDVVALTENEGRLFVCPGYPRVNLWAESADALFGTEDPLPLISINWNKHFLPLNQQRQFEGKELPLGVIYVLGGRRQGLAEPIIEDVTGRAALLALIGNTYMNHVLHPVIRRREFQALGRIATQIPIRSVTLPADATRLSLVCERIISDARQFIGSESLRDSAMSRQ